jgi:hypothetical protein
MVMAGALPQLFKHDVNQNSGRNRMRMFKAALVAAFALASSLTVMSVGSYNAAEAKAHVTKGKPGKCGMGKFYSKKDKGCVAK